jgi:uncharacterized protein YecT (DUF1311 family)
MFTPLRKGYLIWIAILAISLGIENNVLAQAENSKTISEYDKCQSQHTDNVGWWQCGKEEIDRQQAALDKIWKKASEHMKSRSEKGFNDLVEEQKLWEAWKDKTCEYINHTDGLNFGREKQVLDYPMCRIQLIKQRLSYLYEMDSILDTAMDWK